MKCRHDDGSYVLEDGSPCRVDEYGDPTHHCTAKRGCANHIGADELTCARCIGRTRQDIRQIVELTPHMLPIALHAGVNSEAANLAGPAADPEAWAWHQAARRRAILERPVGDEAIEIALRDELAEDDPHHPNNVLGSWVLAFAEDYEIELPPSLTLTYSAAFLERVLPRVAQDPGHEFRVFKNALRDCRSHLESVMRNSSTPQGGAPCPVCPQPAPKLRLQHGHWCEYEACTRIHYPQDPDVWACPRDRSHAWEDDDYRKWVADVYEANRSA